MRAQIAINMIGIYYDREHEETFALKATDIIPVQLFIIPVYHIDRRIVCQSQEYFK